MATKDKRIDQLPAVTILSLDSLLVLQQNGQALCMTAQQLLDYIQNNVNVGNAVKFISQSLTSTQKKQARTNIGAAATGDIPSGVVLYTSQTLTEAQKLQARSNIGAAAIGEGSGGSGTIEGAVLYVAQTLTEEQQMQARKNIRCGSVGAPSDDCVASGNLSCAEGWGTKATGLYSHSEGANTEARSESSHAEGTSTIANGAHQHVQGRYNIVDTEGDAYTKGKYLHIVGNGRLQSIDGEIVEVRSNAHTLDWDGNAWYAGYVEGTAMILKSPNGTRFQITVNDSGSLTAAALTK